MQTQRFVLFFILLLAACTPDFPPPEPIDFEDDPRILRGEWAGKATLEAPVEPLAYSLDGSRLLAAEVFETAIYDTSTFDVVAKLEFSENDFKDTVYIAQFSADGKRLVTASGDISLWNALTGELLTTFAPEAFPVSFSADLQRFATISYQEQTSVDIWDMNSQSRLDSFTLPENYDYDDVQLSPDFTMVAALEPQEDSYDYTAVLWNFESKERLLELSTSSGNAGNLLFSADSSLLAIRTSSRGEIRIWSVAAGEFLPSSDAIRGYPLIFSANNQTLVTEYGSFAQFWNVQEGIKSREVDLDALTQGWGRLLFTPQLDQIAWGSSDSQLQVADLASENTVAEIAAIETYNISVDISATYIDKFSYDVSGTLNYKGETYALQGEVFGGDEQDYLKATRSAPDEARYEIDALDKTGEVRWLLEGSPPTRSVDSISLEGSIWSVTGGFVSEFLLER